MDSMKHSKQRPSQKQRIVTATRRALQVLTQHRVRQATLHRTKAYIHSSEEKDMQEILQPTLSIGVKH